MTTATTTAEQLRGIARRLRARHEADREAIAAEQRLSGFHTFVGPMTPVTSGYLAACRRAAEAAGDLLEPGGGEATFLAAAQRVVAEHAPDLRWPAPRSERAIATAAVLDLLAELRTDTAPTATAGEKRPAAGREAVGAWLLTLRKAGEPFSTYRNLAERFGKRMASTCSANTVRKAIESDKALAGWAARGRRQGRRSAPAALSLDAPEAMAAPGDPAESSLPDEVEVAFRRLLARVDPEQRRELEQMTDEGKRLAAESEIEREAEAGPKRRNHKRA